MQGMKSGTRKASLFNLDTGDFDHLRDMRHLG